jgi:hypothetical protein
MVETKLTGKSMEQRVADRLKSSGDIQHSDHHAVHGTGPTRTHSHIHNTRNQQYGEDAKGSGIFGEDRGPANRKGEI